MGCGASTASKGRHGGVTITGNVPVAVSQLDTHDGGGAPAGLQQGARVQHEGEEWTIQYVTSKGQLDIKSAAGDVRYGVAPSDVVPLKLSSAPAAVLGAPRPPTQEVTAADAAAEVVETLPVLRLDGEPLGKPGGSGAVVHRCWLEDHATAGKMLAVKMLATTGHGRPDRVAVLRAEAELCRTLEPHPYLVRFVHASAALAVPALGGLPHCAIVMELLPDSLESLIERRAACAPPKPFGVGRLALMASELAEALRHLHGLNPPLLHRDVKPGNIFFEGGADEDEDGDDVGRADARGGGHQQRWRRLRLGDFDTACRAAAPLVEFTGTPSVSTPPEMFAHEPHHCAADMWAYGMTLQWCLLLGDPLAEATMSDIEERLSASPPALPIFEAAANPDVADVAATADIAAAADDDVGATDAGAAVPGSTVSWPRELEPIAQIARRCCASAPGDRLDARAASEAAGVLLESVRASHA